MSALPPGQPRWHLAAGACQSGVFATELTSEACGWSYSSLRVLELQPGGEVNMATGLGEVLVLPLSGACVVTADGHQMALAGRRDVFSRVTDFAYLPRDSAVTVRSDAGGRSALPGAKATRRLPARYGPAQNVPVEIRGSRQASRQASSPSRPIDVLAEVRTGDVVLVPHGYHGPSMAAPGYDLYYLNVLAGPGAERTMAFCDDPEHAWIRGGWAGQHTDPRLPMATHEERR